MASESRFNQTRKGFQTLSGNWPTAVAGWSVWRTARTSSFRVPGPPMDNCWPSLKTLLPQDMTSGCCGWATLRRAQGRSARRSLSWKRRSTEGGTEPVWNPNGRELFYRSGDKMMAVDITTEPSFAAGKPRVLFEGQYVPTPASFPNYDVTPDGQRFLMLKPSEQAQATPTQINVVLNWFEELKQKVPTGKK